MVREDHGSYGAGGAKKYDLEERTFRFAREIRAFVKTLSCTVGNIEDVK